MTSVLLVLWTAAWAAGSEARAAGSQSEPELQVSVGDYRVVAAAVPWKWGMAEYDPSYRTTELEGEPHYIRLPRYLPVHATIATIARHPLTGDLFELSDPDGDWTRIICLQGPDLEVVGDTIRWQAPWSGAESGTITVVAEDAWGARSEPLELTLACQ